jgi:predicted Zn-dependent protease
MKTSLITLAATIAVVGVIGCGGGGGNSNTNTPLTCGPNYLTPNYVQATDPGDGSQNQILVWAGFPLTIRFTNSESATYGGTNFDTTTTFMEAVNRWVVASGNAIAINQTTASTADITVTVNRLPAAPGAGGTLGFTQISYFPSTGQIDSARITMNTWPGMTQAQFVNGLRGTMTHEVGHALFLQGHSDDANDNMYFQGSSSQDRSLTTRDENSFLTAYCGTFASRSRAAKGQPGEQLKTITIECAGHTH